MIDNERVIQEIICHCGVHMNLIKEIKDVYNSDFYNSKYKCDNCNNVIKITTHELRD